MSNGSETQTIEVLTEVPVPDVVLRAFGLGNDTRKFVGGTLRSLLYTRHVVDPNDKTACRVVMIADMRGGVLAPGKYGVFRGKLDVYPWSTSFPGAAINSVSFSSKLLTTLNVGLDRKALLM